MKVGVLDWGIGGLDTWRRLRLAMPGHDYVYWSDAGFTPYGKVRPEPLRGRVFTVAHCMQVDVLVVACNAASTILEGDFGLPVYGVIQPGIEIVLKGGIPMIGSPTIGILGGDRTIAAGIHQRAFEAAGLNVVALAAQPLSAHVEAGRLDGPELLADLEPRCERLRAAGVTATLLACTHYPALMPTLTRLIGEMRWLDPVDALVAECVLRLPVNNDRTGTSRMLTTGSPDAMRTAAQAAFGLSLGAIDRV